jgi:crossover junction endodeoxyribonuclease RuvC
VSVSAGNRRNAATAVTAPVRIIGIDPGSRFTGYGIIEVQGTHSHCVAQGRIVCGDGPLPGRLLTILRELGGIVAEYRPAEAAIEEVFVRMNVGSALVLGQARGAAICALANAGLPPAEYAPARVKSAVVGHGRAEKSQIQHMVRVMLGLREDMTADASDALAVALCHAHWRNAPAAGASVRNRRTGLRHALGTKETLDSGRKSLTLAEARQLLRRSLPR